MDDRDDFIKKNLHLGYKVLGKKLNLHPNHIARLVGKNREKYGLEGRKPKATTWTPERIEFAKHLLKTHKRADKVVAHHLGISHDNFRQVKRKYKLNEMVAKVKELLYKKKQDE